MHERTITYLVVGIVLTLALETALAALSIGTPPDPLL